MEMSYLLGYLNGLERNRVEPNRVFILRPPPRWDWYSNPNPSYNYNPNPNNNYNPNPNPNPSYNYNHNPNNYYNPNPNPNYNPNPNHKCPKPKLKSNRKPKRCSSTSNKGSGNPAGAGKKIVVFAGRSLENETRGGGTQGRALVNEFTWEEKQRTQGRALVTSEEKQGLNNYGNKHHEDNDEDDDEDEDEDEDEGEDEGEDEDEDEDEGEDEGEGEDEDEDEDEDDEDEDNEIKGNQGKVKGFNTLGNRYY